MGCCHQLPQGDPDVQRKVKRVTALMGEIAAESVQKLLLLNLFSDVINEAIKRSLFLGLSAGSRDGEESGDSAFCYSTLSQTKTIIIYIERPISQ